MAKKPTPLIGELTTTNYGWTKPTVGSSADAWGVFVNADLDAIDSVVHGIQTSIPSGLNDQRRASNASRRSGGWNRDDLRPC